MVRADEPDYPGFLRVILQRHVRELSDLAPAEFDALMRVVRTVEATVRETMQPEKMNVASLGNMTPHLHFHVIPRFVDDRHFPSPVWAAPRRERHVDPQREARAGLVAAALVKALPPG